VLHSIAIAEEQRRSKAAADVASIEAERARFEAVQAPGDLEVEHARAIEESKQARRRARYTLEIQIAVGTANRRLVNTRSVPRLDHDNDIISGLQYA